jgi:Putative transmembrane protein (PGPGW).
VRYPLVGLAFVLLPTGVIAMFTPLAVFEVGSILILASLTILSFEFRWADDLLAYVRRRLQDRRVRRILLGFSMMIVTGYAVLILSRL